MEALIIVLLLALLALVAIGAAGVWLLASSARAPTRARRSGWNSSSRP
jgi:hypothetical protein